MSTFGSVFGFDSPYGQGELVPVADAMLARFWDQYTDELRGGSRPRPNLERLCRILAERWQTLEDAIALLLVLLRLDTATGVWLERYGVLLDLPRRPGWTEAQWRYYMRAKIAALSSNGTAERLLEVGRLLAPAGTPPEATTIRPQYPKGYRIQIPDVPVDLQPLAVELLTMATMAGIRGVVVFYSYAAGDAFAFMPPGNVHGWGFGVWAHSTLILGTMTP